MVSGDRGYDDAHHLHRHVGSVRRWADVDECGGNIQWAQGKHREPPDHHIYGRNTRDPYDGDNDCGDYAVPVFLNCLNGWSDHGGLCGPYRGLRPTEWSLLFRTAIPRCDD